MARLAPVLLLIACPGIAAAGAPAADRPVAAAPLDGGGQDVIESHARWAFQARDVSALVKQADLIVTATWREAMPGRQVELVEGIFLPFTLNRFTADAVIRGNIAPGAEIFLEQTGGMIGERRWQVDDGGPYQAGRYLLFLKQQKDTSFYFLIHPAGRYKIQGQRLISHLPDDRITGRFTKRPVAEVLAEIRAARER